ncbi:BTB and MATH domain-containing protein 38-like [Haliotis rufescens]|uniref:BTB and MATH domain-containing protein 38-like n=1 Tax=Haliotis rufescens TaxID=6454 RepID=UPI001EB0950A|nr:BTB and MATH domain-containing protein 38-like [Haliotis rufescens]
MSNPESSTAAAGAQPSVATAAGVSKEEEPATPGLDDSMFSTPSALTDVALVVEGKKLHVSKALLCLASPAFLKMFEGDFKDKTEVPIADKKYADFVEFLLCFHPSTCKPVQRETLDVLLALADEYEVESLKQRCEQFVLNMFQLKNDKKSDPSNTELVHFLYLSDKYKLSKLLDTCVVKATYRTYEGEHGIRTLREFNLLSEKSKFRILSERMSLLEVPLTGLLCASNEQTLKQRLDIILRTGCSCRRRLHSPYDLSGVRKQLRDDLLAHLDNFCLLSTYFRKDPRYADVQ